MAKVQNASKTPSTPLVPWVVSSHEPDFPRQLSCGLDSHRWKSIHGMGNRDMLSQKCLALVCSIQCPGSVVIKTFDAIRELRDAGIVVAGGFHSPMEKECLEFLLRGAQPVVIVPARGLAGMRLPLVWRTAIDAGRLLIVSAFSDDVRRTNKVRAAERNEFVAALAAAVLIPHASPGGKAEATAEHAIRRGAPVFTFKDDANEHLIMKGALPYILASCRLRVGCEKKAHRGSPTNRPQSSKHS